MKHFDHFAKSTVTDIGKVIQKKYNLKQFSYIKSFLIGKSKQIDILEIGPGHGEFSSIFIDDGYKNYDVVEPNDLMRDNLVSSVRRAKNYQIPQLNEIDNSYDVIIISDVFEHLNSSLDAQKFIAEAARVLKPSGILCLTSPDLLDWKFDFWHCDFSHSNPTSVRRLVQLFYNNDFTVAGYKYFYACFSGFSGFLISRVIKMLTFFTRGNGFDSKFYKLRLTFLRRFMIVGSNKKK